MSSEDQFERIAAVELSLEKVRGRAVKAAQALRDDGAEPHLAEALERAAAQLSQTSRELRQSTYFAVPSGQTTTEAA